MSLPTPVKPVMLDSVASGRMKSCYTRDSVVAVGGGAMVMRLGPRIRRGEELPATRTLARIGVSETDFFRECDAAFKQGAWFARWTRNEPTDGYYHPLMLPQNFSQLNLVPYWLAEGGHCPAAW